MSTLFPPDQSGSFTALPKGFWLHDTVEGTRHVLKAGEVLMSYDADDKAMERYVMVWLHRNQGLRQRAIAKAFGYTQKTLSKWCIVYEKEGMPGLMSRVGRPPKVEDAVDQAIRTLHSNGLQNEQIGRSVQLSDEQVRGRLRRMGLQSNRAPQPSQPCLGLTFGADGEACDGTGQEEAAEEDGDPSTVEPEKDSSEATEPIETCGAEPEAQEMVPETVSFDHDPLNRSMDRAMAAAGVLRDAVPLFAEGRGLSGAGVLLAVPFLVSGGLLECFRSVYGQLGPSFYGLRTTVAGLFLFALLRLNRVEHLQKCCPVTLGRIMGLDRAPEVKTVRRKLSQLAGRGIASELMGQWARQRIEALDDDLLGFLYVDGHTRAYSGKRDLPKTHVARLNRIQKAVTDLWVNDAEGAPLLLVTCEVNEALTLKLEEVVEEIRRAYGDQRPLTVVFDRGGWSPRLFAVLIQAGVHIMTYRKGKTDLLPEEAFSPVEATIGETTVAYRAHEVSVCFDSVKVVEPDGTSHPLWLRQITRLKSDGRQVQVLTSRQDVPCAVCLYRMFSRWRQENFFKYAREEFLLDALPGYGESSFGADSDCPNPDRRALEKHISSLQAKLKRRAAKLGIETVEAHAPWWVSLAGHRKDNAEMVAEIETLGREIELLKDQRIDVPARVSAGTVYQRLDKEKKLIVDVVKMAAYCAESEMHELLHPHYARTHDEGRKLLAAAFESAADISPVGDELRVTIAAQSSPRRTRALAGLCEELNRRTTLFPGTQLQMRFAVAGHV
jgi:transposase